METMTNARVDFARQKAGAIKQNVDDYFAGKIAHGEFRARNLAIWTGVIALRGMSDAVSAALRGNI